MHAAGRIALLVTAYASSGAAAQGLSGPLAAADLASPTRPAQPAKHAAARKAKANATTKRTAVPASAGLHGAPAIPVAAEIGSKASAPADPLSFGMKWNGSNESASQTRIDNLNGSAAGTGAEVGMKLHF